ncbi:MAG TPA: CheR family methyltransferase [Bryobacteraceae bacterium]|nr:CheR family methyltransferase [Bryobacteraceae bacterium]
MSDTSAGRQDAEPEPRNAQIEVADIAPDDQPSSALPFPVVGIGASAGGVEALIDLFSNLAPDTEMAFVVVPHLAPDQKSHLAEILSRKTTMPVAEITNQIRPEPNRVYVLPPKTIVRLVDGALELQPRPVENRVPMAIDHFFRSLAAHQKGRAIGVILSGTDSDGAIGLKLIKGEGGIAIVQAPESARFPDMPRNSISADHVDLIVDPPDIGVQLGQLAERFANPQLKRLREGAAVSGEKQFARILTMLRGVSNVDFRLYKAGTIRRRIGRRLVLRKIDTLEEYLKYLQTHPEELQQLHEDALINVTHFFRDPDVFQVFKGEILPRIFSERSLEQQVRIWVPGCSTGEEVYSLAICLLEFLSDQPLEPSIQIFGTDASNASTEKARLGIYPESIIEDVSADRLRRFFTRVEKGYQISKRLRDLCIFARQNLCNDPPFSKLDLISCRNVLIYFGRDLQRQLIQTFNYALRPNGYLLFGTAETIHEFSDLFTMVDRKAKFYAKAASITPAQFDLPHRLPPPDESTGDADGPAHLERWTDLELQRTVDRLVLSRYGPPGLVINENLEVLQFRGRTAQFVDVAPGPASFQLLHMLRENIAARARDAVRYALEKDVPIRVDDVEMGDRGEHDPVSFEVLPVPSVPARPRCFVILFTRASDYANTGFAALTLPQLARTKEGDGLIAQLQQDLSANKVYLQSLIEERDARNQELISANEEIQSANEELQSTNEELETTKEELQSANEELQTTNEELQQRNLVLTQTTNDLNNLLTNVNIPVLMLNNELQIRHYTPPTQRLMNIRPMDIGRPITDIRLNLKLEDLEPILLDVLEKLGTRELEVQDRDGRWHLLRVRPYRTNDNKIEGLVLVLLDIDQLRKSQQELKEARDFAFTVTESVGIPIVVLNRDLRIRSANNAFRELARRPPEDLNGRFFPDVTELVWNMGSIRPVLEQLRDQAAGQGFVLEHEIASPQYCALQTKGRVVQIDGEPVILLTIEDITARKQAEKIIQREKEQLEGTIRSTTEALGRSQQELRALSDSLIEAQEQERRHVARELHDDISQRLAVLGIDLQHVSESVPQESETRRLIDALATRTAALADDVRKLSHGLHPAMLDDLGLPYALKALGDEFSERENMMVTLQRQNIPERIPQDVGAALYRITQEALRNVAKHAGRTHVKITLAGTEDRIRLEIADFGEGFDMDDVHRGLGLISMSERARLARGTLSVNSALGKGTTVAVEVPLDANEQ